MGPTLQFSIGQGGAQLDDVSHAPAIHDFHCVFGQHVPGHGVADHEQDSTVSCRFVSSATRKKEGGLIQPKNKVTARQTTKKRFAAAPEIRLDGVLYVYLFFKDPPLLFVTSISAENAIH
mmetsp:Transcript_1064/g.2936  ORF Transcript_1064/g.2936 Transcript_1064/m.2936 type:complete len:120 (+) Transcript_1064:1132-1491(+)